VKTPVVGSDVGGIPEIIRPNHTGRLAPPSDAAGLARAIREALGETEATQRIETAVVGVEKDRSIVANAGEPAEASPPLDRHSFPAERLGGV